MGLPPGGAAARVQRPRAVLRRTLRVGAVRVRPIGGARALGRAQLQRVPHGGLGAAEPVTRADPYPRGWRAVPTKPKRTNNEQRTASSSRTPGTPLRAYTSLNTG